MTWSFYFCFNNSHLQFLWLRPWVFAIQFNKLMNWLYQMDKSCTFNELHHYRVSVFLLFFSFLSNRMELNWNAWKWGVCERVGRKWKWILTLLQPVLMKWPRELFHSQASWYIILSRPLAMSALVPYEPAPYTKIASKMPYRQSVAGERINIDRTDRKKRREENK